MPDDRRKAEAAIAYVADSIFGASTIQLAKSRETAEFHFRDVPDSEREAAIIDAAAFATSEAMRSTSG